MDLFDLAAKITLDSTEYESGLKDANKKGESFGSKIAKGFGTAVKVGVAAVAAGASAVSAFATSSVKTGISFDASMSQIAATLGLTVDEIQNNINGAGDTFDLLRAKALEMGAETNFSAEQAADGLNILAMSGFNATQSMSMIEDVLHLAAAGSMDLSSAAGYVSGAMKGFADDTKDAGYYADLMTKGATLANTSVQQLGDAMSSGAAGAAAYNQSADSMTLSLLRLAEQGDVGAAAGTALAAAMKNLYTPTDQAKKALAELGVAAYDESGAARDFNTVVDELSASLAGMTDEQASAYKQTIFGIQGLDAYNKMAVTSSEKVEIWADALSHASDGAGEAAKQYDTMTDNLQGDIDILHSAFDGFKLAISDGLTPTIRDFVQFGSDSFSRLSASFREGGLEGAMGELGNIISDGIGKITGMLPDLINAGASLVGSLAQGILDNLPEISNAALEIITNLLNNITSGDNIESFIESAFTIISNLATSLGDALPELIPAAVEMVLQIVSGLLDNIDLLIDAAISLTMGLVDGLTSAIPLILTKAPEIIEKLTSALIENLPKLLAMAPMIIFKIIDGLLSALPDLIMMAPEIVVSIISGIVSAFTDLFTSGKDMVDKVKEGFFSAVENAKKWGKDMIQNFIDGITEKARALVEKVKSIAGDVKSFLGFSEPEKGPLSDFHTYAPDMMDLFMKGIDDKRRKLRDTVASAFDFGGMIVNGAPSANTTSRPALAGAAAGNFGTVALYLDKDTLVASTAKENDRAIGRITELKMRYEQT